MVLGGYTAAVRLLDRSGLRAVSLAVRRDIESFSPPARPDPDLVEPVETPFDSIPAVTAQLTRLEERLLDRNDRRSVFLTIYTHMTQSVHDAIDRGAFADPAWMRTYLITFANYYRRAFLAFERGNLEAVPDPWRIAFGAAGTGDTLVIQDAYLGVNAHINYDLALTIADVGVDPHRAEKYRDHRAINDILARLVDIQQSALVEMYAEGIADLDAAFGGLDEALTLRSMAEGREQAWRVAVILADVGVPPVPRYARWVLRATATGAAWFILGSHLDPAIHAKLRQLETDGLSLEAIRSRIDRALTGSAVEVG